ncbi:cupin domain-containing protein [Ramlibacter sp.]|uniref:cupin domain-containing protein n=1 Tax=Ramlibacter sp. TaxID=1917967 RepID=UPI0017CD79CA|nr:cupin domain-containing protein [Ramlibacter sp.]MBA2675680.1 cupin domain-containing protein [Ramlibacter sp.]
MTLHASAAALLAQLPGKTTPQWPQGERFIRALAHGTMSVELYAPVGTDPQTPHAQDELYLVHAGTATLVVAGEPVACAPGTVVFVPARAEHRFERFSADFSAWVVFWGPAGGEAGG